MITCKDCIHYFVCEYKPKTNLVNQCADHIDRSRFVELPVGEWIYGEDYFDYPVYRCSNCKEQLDFEEGTPKSNDYRFCPFCGAKMEETKQTWKEREENG